MSLDGISLQIEQLVAQEGLSYIDATIHFCQKFGLDLEEAKEILHPNLIEKIKTEFVKKNYFPDQKIENSIEDFINE